jgi:hypothetical protein
MRSCHGADSGSDRTVYNSTTRQAIEGAAIEDKCIQAAITAGSDLTGRYNDRT